MSKRLIKTAVLLILTVQASALALQPDSLSYTGSTLYNRVQLNELTGFGGRLDITPSQLDSGCRRIIRAYRLSGYYLVRCVREYSAESTAAAVTVSPGPCIKVGEVAVEGNSYLSQAYLRSKISASRGQVLDSARLEHDLSAISQAYADNGFPQAEVMLKESCLRGDSLDLLIGVKENARVIIDKIMFAGNKTTRYSTALRVAGLKEETLFSRPSLEKAVGSLRDCGLFAGVHDPELIESGEPGRQHLQFTVEEGRYNRAYGAVAYNQPAAGAEGWLAGLADLYFGNISGTARSAVIHWDRPRRQNSRLELSYNEPWLLGFDISSSATLSHRVEDSSYVQSSAGLIFKISMGRGITGGVGGAMERVVPGSSQEYRRSLKYSSQWLLESASPLLVGQRLKADWHFKADIGRKQYYAPAAHNAVSKLWGDLSTVRSLHQKHELAAAGHARLVISGEKPVPRYDQFTLGGTMSLRGYYEEQFIANQILWSNLEYRYKPVAALNILLFTDAGYFYDPERTLRGYRAGYGFGIKINTKIGWVNVYYGLGRKDKPFNGKVHFGLESLF